LQLEATANDESLGGRLYWLTSQLPTPQNAAKEFLMAKLKVLGTIFVALLTILPASMSADDKSNSKTTPNTQHPAAPQQVIKGNISKPPPPTKTKEPPPPTKK
jgi:hypothetical protein